MRKIVILCILILSACQQFQAPPPTLRPTATPNPHRPEVEVSFESAGTVDWSQDGHLIAVGQAEQVAVYAFADLSSPIHSFSVPGDVESVAISPDGRLLASGNRTLSQRSGSNEETINDDVLYLWNLETGQELLQLRSDSGPVYRVEFSPDGETLVSAYKDGTVRLWQTGTREHQILLHGDWVTSLAFNHTGSLLATGAYDNAIQIWRVADGENIATLPAHAKNFTSIAFHPSRNLLAASLATNLVIYDLETREVIMESDRQYGTVWDLAFNPTGTVLATGASNRTIQFWDVDTGQELAAFKHQNTVTSLAFSPDGRRLISGSWNQPTTIWNVIEVVGR